MDFGAEAELCPARAALQRGYVCQVQTGDHTELLQVFRAFGDAVRDGLGCGRGGVFGGCEQGVEIERARVHREITGCGSGPLIAWAVPVKLDTVLIGIAEVERLTYAVVGGSVEGNFVSR